MTTKYPLCLVVAELAAQLEARLLRLDTSWVPRELNTQADDLSNERVEDFQPELRLRLDPATHPWLVLARLQHMAGDFYEASRLGGELQVVGRRLRRRKPEAGTAPP